MEEVKSTHAGQAVYSNFTLKLYDWWVLGISNSYLWCCPTPILEQHFTAHASKNHLDVGVGTGYFLEKCLASDTKLALMDLNTSSLEAAATRVQHLAPELYQKDILQPIEGVKNTFDSISINYLLHCLPGPMSYKTQIFEHLAPLLNSGGKVFGSTILGNGIEPNWGAKKLMGLYNRKGIFDNAQDSFSELKLALEKHFVDVDINLVGLVAVFAAVKK